ncbi:MAG: Coproheme decarboxylase HemQ (no EC), partial [uncultured Gemmatimonadetes bacterium]
ERHSSSHARRLVRTSPGVRPGLAPDPRAGRAGAQHPGRRRPPPRGRALHARRGVERRVPRGGRGRGGPPVRPLPSHPGRARRGAGQGARVGAGRPAAPRVRLPFHHRGGAVPRHGRGRPRARAALRRVPGGGGGGAGGGAGHAPRAVEALSRGAGGDEVPLVLPHDQAARGGGELVHAGRGGAQPADAGPRDDGAAVRRARLPGDHRLGGAGRVGVGRDAVRARPPGVQAHRHRDALRRGQRPVRRVRAILHGHPSCSWRVGRRAGRSRRL